MNPLKMIFRQFVRYLLIGSESLYVPKTWLADEARLRSYTAYTMRQLQQGCVVKDVAATRREAFWQQIEAKAGKAKTLPFQKQRVG